MSFYVWLNCFNFFRSVPIRSFFQKEETLTIVFFSWLPQPTYLSCYSTFYRRSFTSRRAFLLLHGFVPAKTNVVRRERASINTRLMSFVVVVVGVRSFVR
jgi:hypothetical protein